MTTVEQHSSNNCSVSSGNAVTKRYFVATCEPETCVFAHFLQTSYKDSNSLLSVLKRIENALTNTLPDGRIGGLHCFCDCLATKFDRLISELLLSLSDENIVVRRAATQCLRLLSRVSLALCIDYPRHTQFVNCIVRYGLSTSTDCSVKLALCTALPQLLTSELFGTYEHQDLALDFDPLIFALIESFISSSDCKSAYKYAFVSILRVLGKNVWSFLHDKWKKKNVEGLLPTTHLKLYERWSGGLFRCEKEQDQPLKPFLKKNISGQNLDCAETYSLLCASYDLRESAYLSRSMDCSAFIRNNCSNNNNSICYEDVKLLLSRAIFERLVNSKNVLTKSVDSPNISEAISTHKAVEELRKSVACNITNTSGLQIIFGQDFWESLVNRTNNSSQNVPHSQPLISLLKIIKKLIVDENFNVAVCALEIAILLLQPFQSLRNTNNLNGFNDTIHLSLENAKWLALKFLKLICTALSDSRLVVRVAGTKLSLSLAGLPFCAMIIVREFTGCLFSYHVNSKNLERDSDWFDSKKLNVSILETSRLREEGVDLITSLLLTLPSSEFDLPEVCKIVIFPGLTDLKLSVSYEGCLTFILENGQFYLIY